MVHNAKNSFKSSSRPGQCISKCACDFEHAFLRKCYMFTHHWKIVSRIMKVKDSIVVCILWKQIHADACAIDMCFCIFCQRRNAFHCLVFCIHFWRGYCGISHTLHRISTKYAKSIEPRTNRNVWQSSRVLSSCRL